MSLFLLLLLCFPWPTAAESTAHGLLARTAHGFGYSGLHTRKDTRQCLRHFRGSASVPSYNNDGLLAAMNGRKLLDTSCNENEAYFPIITVANGSTGFPYFVSVAPNVRSYWSDITNPSPENGRNMTSLPSSTSNEYFANKNGHIEALGRETLTYHLEACARHVEYAIIRKATLNNSGLIDHLFTGASAFTNDIPPMVLLIRIGLVCLVLEALIRNEHSLCHQVISNRRARLCIILMLLITTVDASLWTTKRSISLAEELISSTTEGVTIELSVWWISEEGSGVSLGTVLLFFLLSIPTVDVLLASTERSKLIAEKLTFSTEDARTELSVFQNRGTNTTRGWISEEGKEKNNLLPDDDLELFEEEGECATKDRSEKTYKKLRVGTTSKRVVSVKFIYKFIGSFLIITSLYLVATLPFTVYGEFSSHEDRKVNEHYYGELIYDSHRRVNNPESFEDHTRTDIEHSSSTAHVKDGENDVKLRILVPTKNTFPEFVNVDHGLKGNGIIATGYSIDVFIEVMDSLPNQVSYEFFPYENGNCQDNGYYDELIQQLPLNRYDGVVGDITITSNRIKYGDFTLPYMMSGVCMIVPVVGNHTESLWWFLKPFTWGLWVLIIALYSLKVFLFWYFEHENNPEFQGTFSQLVGKTFLFFPFIFDTAQKEKLKSKYSRLVIDIWIFELLALGTFYNAILQSMLSSNTDGPIITGIEQLILNGDYVGYQKGSFVFDLLKHKGFQEQKLKAYSSTDEYAAALSKGTRNNGVSAIIDETPYIKVFLTKYPDQYTMAGPTFGPSGFGFLFKRGGAIVPNFSKALLKFIEGEKMPKLEKKWFGTHHPNPPPNQAPRRLSIHGFLGIVLITIPIAFIELLVFIIFKKFKCWKTRRSLPCNCVIEASNTEEVFNSSDIEMNGSRLNESSHIVEVGSDQTTPTENPLEVEVIQTSLSNTEMAFQDNVVPSDETENMEDYLARSSTEDFDTIAVRNLNRDR